MSAQGYRQAAAFASVDVLSTEAMLRASIEEFRAAALQGDLVRLEQAHARCRNQQSALLKHMTRQAENERMAILTSANE